MKEGSRDLFNKVDDFLTEKLKGYDELKNVVTHGLPAHLANDLAKLRKERDKVLQRLGEQTFQLLSQGKLIVPGIVQATFRTAQEIVERITRIELDAEAVVPETAPAPVEPEKTGEPEPGPRQPVKAAKAGPREGAAGKGKKAPGKPAAGKKAARPAGKKHKTAGGKDKGRRPVKSGARKTGKPAKGGKKGR